MPTYTLKDGTSTFDRRLDRIPAFDPRSLHFPARGALNSQQQRLVTKLWDAPAGTQVLDQGQEGACFPAETLVRLSTGAHKRIADIRPLDEVVTAEGRFGTVTHVMVREANRGLVTVRIAGHLPLRCTPEHPILTQRGYVAAEELTTADKVAITRWNIISATPGIQPHALVDVSDLRGVVAGQVSTGGVTTTVSPMPEWLFKTPDLGRLLGLYAAEGHTTANKVVWSFGGHEKDTLVADTVALIKTCFDAQPRIQERPNGVINVVLYGKAWRRLFEVLIPGTSKHGDKHLSFHVTHGPDSYRQALLDGWIAGDGHRRRTEISGVTVCRQLALDMHGIANGFGLKPALRQSKPSLNEHAAIRQTRYDLSWGTGGGSNRSAKQDEHAVWRSVRSVEAEEFTGHVYNIEVERDHSYVANGVGVHNCVGFGTTNELLWNPVPVPNLDNTFAREKIYWVAQEDDPWPGGSYPGATPRYEGTSVLYGVKAAADLGYYTEYRWATSETEMALAVGHLGPAIIGVDWYQGQFQPDSKGFIHVSGDKAGGHCTLIIGIDVKGGYYTLHNSWGASWGTNGNAKISRKDMAKLLGDNGECCVITGRALPPPTKRQAEHRAEDIIDGDAH